MADAGITKDETLKPNETKGVGEVWCELEHLPGC